MAYPVTLNGRTYTLADFEGTNYVEGLPDAFEDFVTHAGDIYNDTSTTSNSIGTGSKTFTVSSGKPYQAGTPLRIADAAAPSTNFLDAVVTSYSGTTLVVEAIGYGGSGTKTSWTVNIGGAKTIDGTLGVSQGGTGGTTAAAARTNLDTYSKSEADSRFLNVSGEASDVTMTGNVTIGDADTDTFTINATTTATADIEFGDNDKAIFGAGSDLQIYHDGSHSYVDDQGTGQLRLRGTTQIQFLSGANDYMATMVNDGAVNLYYDNAIKLATTSTGIDVTGTVTADGLTVDGDATFQTSDGAILNLKSTDTSNATNDFYGSVDFISSDASSSASGRRARIAAKAADDSGGSYLTFETSEAFNLGDDRERLRINKNGDISFYEDTGTTPKFFWDASAESLGIGTSSPEAAIHVVKSGDNGQILIGSSTTDATLKNGGIAVPHYTNAEEDLFVISGQSNSTYSNVYIGGGAGAFNAATSVVIYTGSSTTAGAGAERMRIDSSGNLLVGKTSTAFGTAGIAFGQSGQIAAVRSGNAVADLNRLSTDGSIVNFYKDGSTVGSIGGRSGDLYIVSGDHGVRVRGATNEFIPTGSFGGTDSNGEVDLGGSGTRFKDLYLSGGVYLGGTGSANKLDDYETGTWTPSFNLVSTVSYIREGFYRKVGGLVYVHARLFITDSSVISGESGGLRVEGLPFANAGTEVVVPVVASRWGTSTASNIFGTIINGNSYVDIHYDSWITSNALQDVDKTTIKTGGTNQNIMRLSFSYPVS